MSDSGAFKHSLNANLARRLGSAVRVVYPQFNVARFVEGIVVQLESLELKDRVKLFSTALLEQLPDSFPEAWEILEQLIPGTRAGEVAEPGPAIAGDAFALWPLAQFIEDYGQDHFDAAVVAMHRLTPHSSAEFAVRPFLIRYPAKALKVLSGWAVDPDEHVRRLASEGSRPRLPWAGRLNQFIRDPAPTLRVLELLKDDPSEYVRRSVANHLNDIGKDHPEVLLDVAARWWRNGSRDRRWTVRHALRSLVKAGNVRALEILGYGEAAVSLEKVSLDPKRIQLGEAVELSFTLAAAVDRDQALLVDYVVHFVKASGRTSPKVFKLTKKTLAAGQRISVSRRHEFKPISTRVYYSGVHRVEIQVNGKIVGGADFVLDVH